MEVGRSGGPSSSELCFSLRHESVVRFAIVRVLHTDRLRLGFALESGQYIHIEFAVQHLLGLANGERWTTCQLSREIMSGGTERGCGHNAVVESDALGFVCADEISREQHFGGFRESDHTRQQIRGRHIRSCQAHLHKQKRDLCFFTRDANVRSECDTSTSPGGSSVQAGDHRFRKQANVSDELASHASELEQSFHVAAEKLADDVMHIAARAERSARSSDHNYAHGALFAQCREQISQFPIDFKCQCVETFGPVQRDRRDAVFVLLVEKGGWLFHSTAIASISTFAASSSSATTWTRTIAGKCFPMYF